ncbi:MAG: hypothetical protein IH621_01155 [Krumholzibacteria bacterium]|nr:hypothetical protein [Candidatus Krumholzibacteria bacterium]
MTMRGNYIVISRSGALRLFKETRQQRRDQQVRIEVGGVGVRTLPFPAALDALDIADLPPAADVTLSVRPARGLRRLLEPPFVVETRPQVHRLRGLITGSGRCGTQSLALWLDGMTAADGVPVRARHETLAHHLLPLIEDGRADEVRQFVEGFSHGIECAPHFSLVPTAIAADAVIRIIRDGRRVVQSGRNRGWYANQSPWNRVKPVFPGDAFAQSCHFWVHTNRNLDGVATHTFRLEDLIAAPAARNALLAALDLPPSGRPLPAANAGHRSSQPSGWSAEEHETFAQICGGLMDEHYPGWRAERAETPSVGGQAMREHAVHA